MVAEITFGPYRSNESPNLSDVYIKLQLSYQNPQQ